MDQAWRCPAFQTIVAYGDYDTAISGNVFPCRKCGLALSIDRTTHQPIATAEAREVAQGDVELEIIKECDYMAGKKTAVFGIYSTIGQAERAVDSLVAHGFSSGDVSVLLPDNQSAKDFAHEKHTKAPEGTTTGVTAGGAIGGRWDCWRVSARWQFPASGRSSRRGRSWRGVSRMAACCCRSTATRPTTSVAGKSC
jgi:hypothetical protein